MPKTHDEIKLGVASCLGCDNERPLCLCCPYKSKVDKPHCGDLLREDVLVLIQQLQAENAELRENIQWMEAERDDFKRYIRQLEAERDALSEELKSAHSCFACKKFRRNGGECCGGSVCMMRDFEWRGVTKEA